MSLFEILSIITAWLQLGLIGGGLWLMQQSGQRRDRQLDRQEQLLADIGAGIREQSAGIREQSAGIREQSAGIREQSAGIRALLERTG